MNEYPLHRFVYENDVTSLKQELAKTSKTEIDVRDLRNKTALELAIFLDHFECVKTLVEHGADCASITKEGWNLVQEAVSTGNSTLIKLVMTYRDYQRTMTRKHGIPELLKKLKQAPDFFVEMKWEFTSWIPLISKACPSDVYKVYKSGGNVRIDTTLVGFNGTTWERGNRSFIFQASDDGSAKIIEIDHLMRTYHVDKLASIEADESGASGVDGADDDFSPDLYEPDDSVIENKLRSPNMVTFLDIEKIEFERSRSGLWGWRTDKNETIGNYECRVYTAHNLQLVTKTRVEHLNSERARAFLRDMHDNDMDDCQSAKQQQQQQQQAANGQLSGFLTSFLQTSEQKIKMEKSARALSAGEYFQRTMHIDYYLNGSVRAIDETRKIQTFNATLSLCDHYPLSLREQVSPIVDLMALNNSHFKKLKEFITLQLPSGFPLKIEIPLYRVITAKVTFGNIHGLETNVDLVTTIKCKNAAKSRLSKEDDDDDESTSESSERCGANVNDSFLDDDSNQNNANHSDENDDAESTHLIALEAQREAAASARSRRRSRDTKSSSRRQRTSATAGAAASGGGGGGGGSKAAAAAATAFSSMCVVDELAFKIPASYRCTNYYPPSEMAASLYEDRGSEQSSRARAGLPPSAGGAGSGSRAANHFYSRAVPVDDDDILLQIAIQQSVAAIGGRQGDDSTTSGAVERARNSSGGTQSLQEYHDRQNNLLLNPTDEELLLQRVLAESLSEGGGAAAASLRASVPFSPPPPPPASPRSQAEGARVAGEQAVDVDGADDELWRVLEMSKRDEEERRRRELVEDEELRQILELSLIDK